MHKSIVFQFLCQLVLINLCVEVTTEQLVNDTVSNFNGRDFNTDNWTSCEEFLVNTTFDRNQVVDVDWKIFYFWNLKKEKSYHLKFRVPSRLMTDRFRVELDKELEPPVNWTEADLFIETSIDFSGLFIRTDMSGKYRLIPSIAFQVKSVPYMTFALKYVEPGYLGIMNCKHRLCYALAPVDKMPKPEDLKLEAEKIGIHNEHGHSYLVAPDPRPPPTSFSRDDVDDDEDLDIKEHGFQGNDIDARSAGLDGDDDDED